MTDKKEKRENTPPKIGKVPPMSEKDWADVIHIVRAAPLSNMDAAEAVAGLLTRLDAHVDNLG